MDAIFGGNEDVEDMARIADIRRRLGISEAVSGTEGTEDDKMGSERGVSRGVKKDKGLGLQLVITRLKD